MGSSRFHRDQAAQDAAGRPATPDAVNAVSRLRAINPSADRSRGEPSEGLIDHMAGDEALIAALGRVSQRPLARSTTVTPRASSSFSFGSSASARRRKSFCKRSF